jgi:hypothetical protein
LPDASDQKPTAMQEVADGHDTLVRKLDTAPAGAGVLSFAQPLPFQRSASGTSLPPLAAMSPTAMQSLRDRQDTPSSTLAFALGVLLTVQLLPFQVSANEGNTLPLSSAPPTARQKPADGQDTWLRPLAIAPGSSGGNWTCHSGASTAAAGVVCASMSTPASAAAPASAARAIPALGPSINGFHIGNSGQSGNGQPSHDL